MGSGFADRPGVPAGSRPREPTDSLRLKTGRQAETEAASIRYVAEMQGADMGSERTIRWLIALMVLCCDPLAIALTAAAPIRGSTTL